jgi:hypothetical protein
MALDLHPSGLCPAQALNGAMEPYSVGLAVAANTIKPAW